MQVQVSVDPHSEPGRYLVACARLRNINMSSMIRLLVSQVAEDQLVRAVLDDEEGFQRGPHVKKFREPVS
jgi:hypothetical protein